MSFLPRDYQNLLSMIYTVENSLKSNREQSATTDLTVPPDEGVKKIAQTLTQNIDLFTDRSSLLTLFTKVIHLEESLGDGKLKQTLQTVHQLFETKIDRLATPGDLPLDRSLELTAAIEELQELTFHDLTTSPSIINIQSWFVANQATFDKATLEALPIDQQLRLIALLAPLKNHPLLHSYFISRLSKQMASYSRQFSTINRASALQGIKNLFTTPENQRIALAHFINSQHTPLEAVVDALSLTKEDLLCLAPYLKYADLRNCNVFNDSDYTISFLNNCSSLTHLFIKNPRITHLPPLPLCTTLNCSECLALKELPELPLCTTLNCYFCPNLTALPELPLCRALDCFFCLSLTTLPALPLCTTLNCSKCQALTALPLLPLCTTLECSNCEALTALPELRSCTTLNCSYCRALRAIPELPLCTTLECSNCEALTVLPELPLCTILNCSNCQALSALPLLPSCRTLYCENCPSLQGLPELLQNITLYTGNTNPRLEFTKLIVKTDELKKNPEKYLLQLGQEFLLKGRPFPNIYYLNPDGSACEAIDVGGIRRDFISSLFERLFIENHLSIDLGPPIYPKLDRTEETKLCYQIIGNFFALCYPKDSFFKIGEIFDENFFTLMKLLADSEISEETLIRSILLLKIPQSEIREEIFASAENPSILLKDQAKLYADTFVDPDTADSLRENLIEEARKDQRLLAIQVIASEMKSQLAPNIWNEFTEESAADSQARIQGSLSKDLLIRMLDWKQEFTVSNTRYTKTQDFLKNWINKASKEELKDFVKVVTGNNTLGPNPIKIKIFNRYTYNDRQNNFTVSPITQELIPTARTCFFQLDLPSEYPNQERFDEKLKMLIEEGNQGFQIS